MTRIVLWSVSTKPQSNSSPKRACRFHERNGTANMFMMFAPLEGWRHVKVTDRHTAVDYAHTLKDLSDSHFPDARKIILVQDNLNTHKPASLYELPPKQGGSSNGSNGITLQSMAVGSTCEKVGAWKGTGCGLLAACGRECCSRFPLRPSGLIGLSPQLLLAYRTHAGEALWRREANQLDELAEVLGDRRERAFVARAGHAAQPEAAEVEMAFK
jgi:hypothetical protein